MQPDRRAASRFGCDVEELRETRGRVDFKTADMSYQFLRLFTSLCCLYFSSFLLSLASNRSAVSCVFSIKWTWKGIRFIIYGIFSFAFSFRSLPLLKDSRWHVILILLTLRSTFCVYLFLVFFLYSRNEIYLRSDFNLWNRLKFIGLERDGRWAACCCFVECPASN